MMALIMCQECKKMISETASSCPNCGYQLTPEIIAEIKKQASGLLERIRQDFRKAFKLNKL